MSLHHLPEESTGRRNAYFLVVLRGSPEPEVAPSLMGIIGRYVFTSEIFAQLELIKPGKHDELQLTDAMKGLTSEEEMYYWVFGGTRYDIGNMKDWFNAHLQLSLKSEFANDIHSILDKI